MRILAFAALALLGLPAFAMPVAADPVEFCTINLQYACFQEQVTSGSIGYFFVLCCGMWGEIHFFDVSCELKPPPQGVDEDRVECS